MPPHLESMYYGCMFQFMSSIVLLMILQIYGRIAYHMVVLHKNSSKSLISCISTHHKVFVWIWNFQDWCICKKILQLLESFFSSWCPVKLYPLLLQRSDRMCNLGESFNEPPVVPCKSHKRSHMCHISWGWPINDGLNLLKVHRYTLLWDNVTC